MNGLFGSVLSKRELIVAGLEAEAAVSGYHADNVGPSLLGGFILIRCAQTCAGRCASPAPQHGERKCMGRPPALSQPAHPPLGWYACLAGAARLESPCSCCSCRMGGRTTCFLCW